MNNYGCCNPLPSVPTNLHACVRVLVAWPALLFLAACSGGNYGNGRAAGSSATAVGTKAAAAVAAEGVAAEGAPAEGVPAEGAAAEGVAAEGAAAEGVAVAEFQSA